MLYFDEAHVLVEKAKELPESANGKNLYDVLCWVLDLCYPRSAVFALFMSTTSQLGATAPAGPLARSNRIRVLPEGTQAPISPMSFDVSPRFPINPETCTLEDISSISFMSPFGRVAVSYI